MKFNARKGITQTAKNGQKSKTRRFKETQAARNGDYRTSRKLNQKRALKNAGATANRLRREAEKRR